MKIALVFCIILGFFWTFENNHECAWQNFPGILITAFARKTIENTIAEVEKGLAANKKAREEKCKTFFKSKSMLLIHAETNSTQFDHAESVHPEKPIIHDELMVILKKRSTRVKRAPDLLLNQFENMNCAQIRRAYEDNDEYEVQNTNLEGNIKEVFFKGKWGPKTAKVMMVHAEIGRIDKTKPFKRSHFKESFDEQFYTVLDALPGDQRGHSLSSSMNGPAIWYNLMAQNGEVNQGRGVVGEMEGWRCVEAQLLNFAQNHGTISWRLYLHYPDFGAHPNRPDKLKLCALLFETGMPIVLLPQNFNNPVHVPQGAGAG